MRRGIFAGRVNRERVEPTELLRAPAALSLRDEKILLTLVVQTQQINDRLTRLENRFDAVQRDAHEQPDQHDLLELRMHSARLATELSRVTIELRAEINELAKGLGDASGADDIAPPDLDRRPPEDDEREPLIDLRDPPSPRPRAKHASGWRPARVPKRPADDE